MPPDPVTGTPVGILFCQSCRKVIDCSLADRLRYTRDGWPKCCSEVMGQYGPVGKSNTHGQAGETPREGTQVD